MSPHSNCNAFCSFLLSLTITAYIVIAAIDSPSPSSSCPPHQRDSLLQLKNSFFITQTPPIDFYGDDACKNTSYPKTASWKEDRDCCSWGGVACDNSTGHIVGLDLSCARLRGAIDSKSSLFSLRHLRSLSLFGNDLLRSTIPLEIRVFSRMMHLNISSSNVSGNVPTEISQLSKLVSLDLSGYGLKMQNPTMRLLIRNLTQLEELNLSSVNMSGVVSTSMMNCSSSMISLHLSDCSLGGKFPDYIFQLPNLQKLDLSYNSSLNSTLPESNWSSSLAFLSLGDCSFAGGVPLSIGSLPRLTYLDLSGNNFTGHVDFQTFSPLKNLRFLGLSRLSVSGEDATDANHMFPKLEKLDLSRSTLINFPCFLSNMPELMELNLSWSFIRKFVLQCVNNDLSFPQLQFFEMSSCKLTKFPSFLSRSNKLRLLDLSGNMIKQIPSWFWGIGTDTLEELKLQDNLIRGGLRLPWKRLANLHVEDNLFEGPLPIPLTSSILEFVASQNHFNGSISPSICQLTHLQDLELGQNDLTGVIPQCLGNLTDLYKLDLSSNSLMGLLPPSLVNCTSMLNLDVSFNSFNGSIWPSICLLTHLQYLALGQNNLTGVLPPCLGNLTDLFHLDLWSNSLTGPLPLPSHAMGYYSVSNNHFSGEISSLIYNATNLQLLDMSNNDLTGTLPHCLKNVTIQLNFLSLRANGFQGLIPEIFHEQSSLKFLDFSRNQFEGSLPRSLSNCKSLEVLDVGSNKIVDSFPDWLGDLPLKVLSLRSNKFQGHLSISQGTRLFSELRILDLSNNGFKGNLSDNLISEMFGMARGDGLNATRYMTDHDSSEYYSVMIDLKGVETEMVKIYSYFATLDLSSNRFCGEIPRNIGLLKSLKGLNFSHNGYTGTIPQSIGNLTNLESLDLSSNNFSGEINSLICNATNLQLLDLSNNDLTGTLPHCLKNVTVQLYFLNLQANGFQGSIPEIFHEGCGLMSLDFSRNQFEGSLPRSLSNCTSLEVLAVGNNKIVDSFPDWLGDLPLKVLSLRSNKFRGHLRVSQGTRLFSELRILDLSNNGFKGNLSDNLISEMFGMAREDGGNATGYLTLLGSSEYFSVMIDWKGVQIEMVKINVQFSILDLSSNRFCGEIPRNIGLLKSLKSLNFSYNNFMGTIPPSLGNLTNLESLDLSSNHLVGEIPKELVKLTSLGALDLSWNNLAGPIPSGGHFNTFTDSFEGNPRLCGIPLTRVCGQGRAEAQLLPDQRDNGKDEPGGWFEWTFMAMGFGCGVGIGIALGCMALEIGRPLWLARMVIRLEGSGRKRSKRKAPRRNSQA